MYSQGAGAHVIPSFCMAVPLEVFPDYSQEGTLQHPKPVPTTAETERQEYHAPC